MSYRVKISKNALKQLKKMDQYTRTMLVSWIEKNLDGCENPYFQGKALKGKYSSLWIYRIGNYRVISRIENNEMIILVIEIGHRKEVYR